MIYGMGWVREELPNNIISLLHALDAFALWKSTNGRMIYDIQKYDFSVFVKQRGEE